jgi:hypothetical protein
MEAVLKGSTDITLYFVLVDDGTGLPLTGVAHTDVTGSYVRTRGTRTAITMANLAAPDSAHSDGGWEEVDGTNQPGLYRFDIPDAAFATGARAVIVTVKATGAKTEHQYLPLWDVNTQDGVRAGLTALPNAAADAAGGLIISDAGGLDADAQRSDVAAILVDTGTTLDGKIDTIDNFVDDLESRLTAGRATNLDNLDAAISSRSTVTTAQVNAEVVDALATDTYAEPAAVPAATASLSAKIGWLQALARNKVTQTATTQTLRNDADSGDVATAAVSDDTVTFTRAEWS